MSLCLTIFIDCRGCGERNSPPREYGYQECGEGLIKRIANLTNQITEKGRMVEPKKIIDIEYMKTWDKKEKDVFWEGIRSQNLIGASRAAGICDVGWNTPFSTYCHMKRLVTIEPTDGMNMGKIMEKGIIEYLPFMLEAHGFKWGGVERDTNLYQCTLPNKEYMIGQIDGWIDLEGVEGPGILEIKFQERRGKDWGNGGVPEYHCYQVAHYMVIHQQAKYVIIAALVQGCGHIRMLRREDLKDVIDKVVLAEKEFREKYLIPGTFPQPGASDRDTEVIGELFHKTFVKKPIEVDGNFVDLLKKYESLGAEIRRLEKERKEIKNNIKFEMKDYQTAMVGNKPVVVMKEINCKGYTVAEKKYVKMIVNKKNLGQL